MSTSLCTYLSSCALCPLLFIHCPVNQRHHVVRAGGQTNDKVTHFFSRLSRSSTHRSSHHCSIHCPYHAQTDFETAAERVKTLKQKPNNDQLLQLYGLYKQATAGDVNTSQPWAVQMEARAKWDAWNARKGPFGPISHPTLEPKPGRC